LRSISGGGFGVKKNPPAPQGRLSWSGDTFPPRAAFRVCRFVVRGESGLLLILTGALGRGRLGFTNSFGVQRKTRMMPLRCSASLAAAPRVFHGFMPSVFGSRLSVPDRQ